MDLTPVTDKIASAFSAVKGAAGTAATGAKEFVVWSGHKIVWLGSAALEGVKAGISGVGSFVKASWVTICKGVQTAWQTSSPYLASTANFFKANLVKLGGFLSSGPGVALLSSVSAVLLTNWALQDTDPTKRAKTVAILTFALLSAAATGILVAQAGLFPVLI